jgi:hypothetical protein
VVIVSGPNAAADCSSLSTKLPAGDWKLVMGKLYGSYSMCKGTIGSSSIQVLDTRFTEPPTWTTDLCSKIAAGTLGVAPGGPKLLMSERSHLSLMRTEAVLGPSSSVAIP